MHKHFVWLTLSLACDSSSIYLSIYDKLFHIHCIFCCLYSISHLAFCIYVFSHKLHHQSYSQWNSQCVYFVSYTPPPNLILLAAEKAITFELHSELTKTLSSSLKSWCQFWNDTQMNKFSPGLKPEAPGTVTLISCC